MKGICSMKQVFKIENLDCAHCAQKLEDAINKIQGVSQVRVDFLHQKLTLSADNAHFDEIVNEMLAVSHAIEPEVTFIAGKQKAKTKKHTKTLLRIILAAVLFAAITLMPATPVPLLFLYLIPYLLIGGDILLRALKNICRGQVFDENFLMALATIGAFAIHEYPEAVAVMLFYQVGELFQNYAVGRSRQSITQLLNICPDTATVLRNGELIQLSPEDVTIGETIIIRPGEKIPLDGVITEGTSALDTSALTGESLPRTVCMQDEVLSGCINQSGLLHVQVTKPFAESTVAKILELVENAGSKKAKTENFISRFSRYYTPCVVICAVFLAFLVPLITGDSFSGWLHRALIFLVVSCPCALVISVPLSFFGGIGGASKQGILIKGGNYLEALAKAEIFVFDKTGTLTEGVFRVTSMHAVATDEATLLELAAHAESYSAHPIAESIRLAYGKDIAASRIGKLTELAGLGIRATVDKKTVLLGNKKLMEESGISCPDDGENGTTVHIASNGTYLGSLLISDRIKPEAADALAAVKALGIKETIMLTGDTPEAAGFVSAKLKLDRFFAGLLPADKLAHAERLMQKGTLAFVGDGMNDAPVLACAHVGIAMGAMGQDAAIEAADIVLMDDAPSKIPAAIKIARKTMSIVHQNIIFALGVKAAVLLLGALGIANMWFAVFADVGVSVLAIVNAMRTLHVKK